MQPLGRGALKLNVSILKSSENNQGGGVFTFLHCCLSFIHVMTRFRFVRTLLLVDF